MRRRLETKLLAEMAAGLPGTREMIRRIDVMTACGGELYKRGAQLDPPPFVEVDQETVLGDPASLIRSRYSYRVF